MSLMTPLFQQPLGHPRPNPSSPVPLNASEDFHRLTASIRSKLGPNNGIAASQSITTELKRLMEQYPADESSWKYFAFGDQALTFTRNLVDRGNGNFNLLVLVWSPGRESPVHDHADSHCIMKILQGSLTETRYAWPTSPKPAPMQMTQSIALQQGQVSYMSDTLGLHTMSNPDPKEYAVSLHLYTPPNAAVEGCHVFDPETGMRRRVTVYEYYSEYGEKVKR